MGSTPPAVFPLWSLWKALGSDCALCLQARLEVHRFGITGYGKGKERVLEQERAIMLGARPPKNSYVNYKVLQEHIKEKKAAKEEEKRTAKDTDIFKKKKRKGQEDR